MRHLISLMLALVAITGHCRAAENEPDTVAAVNVYPRPAVNQTIAPAALVAVGSVASASHWWRRHVDGEVTRAMGSNRQWRIADAAEWLPYAAMLGADYIGGKARAGIVDRALLTATSFVILEAVTQPLKRIVDRPRPDASDCHSFPSGHTAIAFAGAELTRMTYGPWLGAGAYVVATGVAAMRIAGRHHYLSDVIAGAGIGILSARLASWLLPWERRVLRLDLKSSSPAPPAPSATAQLALIPVASPEAFGASFLLQF